jgi:hypothetical protein
LWRWQEEKRMLDIHLGHTKDSAARTQPTFQFDGTTHAKVFAGGIDKSKFPKLAKIEDYYADAAFITEELPELIKEINETMTRFSADVAINKTLQTFQTTCKSALEANVALFCFAD